MTLCYDMIYVMVCYQGWRKPPTTKGDFSGPLAITLLCATPNLVQGYSVETYLQFTALTKVIISDSSHILQFYHNWVQ